MFWRTADDIIREEIEAVRARRVILDQLEGGAKTGSELRGSIRKDMAAQTVKTRGRKKLDPDEFKVTDPKLYFNTKHLEDVGIISSSKVSQQRVFELNPKAMHPVRRVLNIRRPVALFCSLSRAEEQREFVKWICDSVEIQPVALHLFVDSQSLRGASRNLDRYVPDETKKTWEAFWHDLEAESIGDIETAGRADLRAVYQQIERELLEQIHDYTILVDLTQGPALITQALSLISIDYSLRAIHVYRPPRTDPIIVNVYPRE